MAYEDELTTEERRQQAAVDMIHVGGGSAEDKYYSAGSAYWDVDFSGVVAGYLSDFLPQFTGWDFAALAEGVAVIDNFLRYVIMHDVCPEYDEQVREAIDICDKAKTELPLAANCLHQFPGQFNLACRELYHLEHQDIWGNTAGFQRPEHFDPGCTFAAAVALQGTAQQVRCLHEGASICIVDETLCHLEVDSVSRLDPADEEDIVKLEVFRTLKPPDSAQQLFVLAPIGKAVLKPCKIEDGWDYVDLWNSPSYPRGKETFLLDDEILARLLPGFKLVLTVCRLNIGVKFIKEVHRIHPTFHQFLPQELMMAYKAPRPSERQPRTVRDLDVEEPEQIEDLEKQEPELGDTEELTQP